MVDPPPSDWLCLPVAGPEVTYEQALEEAAVRELTLADLDVGTEFRVLNPVPGSRIHREPSCNRFMKVETAPGDREYYRLRQVIYMTEKDRGKRTYIDDDSPVEVIS